MRHARPTIPPTISYRRKAQREKKKTQKLAVQHSQKDKTKLAHKGRQYKSTLVTLAMKDGVATIYLAQTGTKLACTLGPSSGY